MSKILILHGPSQYEIRKAYELSKYLAVSSSHEFSVSIEVSRGQNSYYINLFDFVTNPLGEPILHESATSPNGGKTVSLAAYLRALIDEYKKVILMPSYRIVSSHGYIFAFGYAQGKNKIVGSLPLGQPDPPTWYQDCLSNTVSSQEDLLNLIKHLK